MTQLRQAWRLGRIALTTLSIGAAIVALDVGPIGNPAQAKNADHGGQGNDHAGGRGGNDGGNGHGSGNGGGNANSHAADHSAQRAGGSDSDIAGAGSTGTAGQGSDDESLSAHGLGKLNGFFHASPQALANASPNSPLGRIDLTFREALSAMAAAEADQDPTDGTTTGPTEADLGAILAGATNKPVTAAQVQAIADRLAALHPEDTALAGFAASADDAEYQKIADEANAVRSSDAIDSDAATAE